MTLAAKFFEEKKTRLHNFIAQQLVLVRVQLTYRVREDHLFPADWTYYTMLHVTNVIILFVHFFQDKYKISKRRRNQNFVCYACTYISTPTAIFAVSRNCHPLKLFIIKVCLSSVESNSMYPFIQHHHFFSSLCSIIDTTNEINDKTNQD